MGIKKQEVCENLLQPEKNSHQTKLLIAEIPYFMRLEFISIQNSRYRMENQKGQGLARISFAGQRQYHIKRDSGGDSLARLGQKSAIASQRTALYYLEKHFPNITRQLQETTSLSMKLWKACESVL